MKTTAVRTTAELRALAESIPVRRRAEMTAGLNGWSLGPWPEFGVTGLTTVDGPLGLVSPAMDERDFGVVLPSGTCVAAMWSREAARAIGTVLGRQARRQGIDIVLGPALALARVTRSGRTFEFYSEDAHLSAECGAAWIEGLQAQGVAACAKHVICNDTETQRHSMNVELAEARLRVTYLLPFERAVRAGVCGIMTGYNRFRGVHCVENGYLVDILRGWGFDGIVMSDYFATKNTLRTARAGIDIEMPGPPRFMGTALADAIEREEVDAEVATRAATHLLGLADRVGALGDDRPAIPPDAIDESAILRMAAARGAVLLRNERNVLPLSPAGSPAIAVIGPNAAQPCYQGGTFGRVNLPPDTPTPLSALTEALRPAEVVHAPGTAPRGIQPLADLDARTPDGQPGLLVEYILPGEDEPAASEVRPGSSFVWFNDIPGLGGPQRGGHIRVSGSLESAQDRVVDLHVGGTGDAVLELNGQQLVRWDRPDKQDIMGVVAREDTRSAAVKLPAEQRVPFVARFDLEPSFVQSVTVGWTERPTSDLLGNAVTAARNADAVILVVGDEISSSRESADRDTTSLPAEQVELIERVADVARQLVVVVNASRAVDLSWAERTDAVLVTWFGGMEMSGAIADIVVGRRAPEGRLPLTFAEREEDYPGWGLQLDETGTLDYDSLEPAGYEGFEQAGVRPRYCFGFGLTYTTFRWDAVRFGEIDPARHAIAVDVDVTNTGDRPGREIVQVYVRSAGEASKRLAGFADVVVESGQSSSVRVELDEFAFRRWDTEAAHWHVPARAEVEVGSSVESIAGRTTITWE